MKQVTTKDTVREAGVSITSASRTLNRVDGISEKKRSRVLRVCERFPYTPNGLVKSLVRRRTQTIDIIMPDIMSPLYPELTVKASDAAHKKRYQVLLRNGFRELRAERDYLKLLAERQVEGTLIFLIGPRGAESMSEFIHGMPMVTFSELMGQREILYVYADEEQAGRIAVKYLISRGRRDLLFVGFKSEHLAYRYRTTSPVETVKIKWTPAQIYECNLDFRVSFERGYSYFKHFP